MIHFLFFIFLLVIFVVLLGLSVIRWFLGGIFGKRPNSSNPHNQQQKNHNNDHNSTNQYSKAKQKKIIDSDEGEYIEYEEIED